MSFEKPTNASNSAKDNDENTISRRGFLKGTVAMAAATLGAGIALSPERADAESNEEFSEKIKARATQLNEFLGKLKDVEEVTIGIDGLIIQMENIINGQTTALVGSGEVIDAIEAIDFQYKILETKANDDRFLRSEWETLKNSLTE